MLWKYVVKCTEPITGPLDHVATSWDEKWWVHNTSEDATDALGVARHQLEPQKRPNEKARGSVRSVLVDPKEMSHAKRCAPVISRHQLRFLLTILDGRDESVQRRDKIGNASLR